MIENWGGRIPSINTNINNGKIQGDGMKEHDRSHNTLVSKEDFCSYCHLLYERQLVTGAGGNLSYRIGDKIFITPSGYSLRDISPDLVVMVGEEGRVLNGGTPTKDIQMHLGILRARDDVNVVCHLHGAFIIAASTLMDPGLDAFPPITPGFVYFAYPLRMLPFVVPGTKELAAAAAGAFFDAGCHALLLQNHGLVTVGENFQQALNVAEEIDEAARIYLLTNGRAKTIPAEGVTQIKTFS